MCMFGCERDRERESLCVWVCVFDILSIQFGYMSLCVLVCCVPVCVYVSVFVWGMLMVFGVATLAFNFLLNL